jgi:hypothetical protein
MSNVITSSSSFYNYNQKDSLIESDRGRAFAGYQDKVSYDVKCYTYATTSPCKHARNVEEKCRYHNSVYVFTLPRAIVIENDEGGDDAMCIDCLLEGESK